MGCLQSSNANQTKLMKDQMTPLVAVNPAFIGNNSKGDKKQEFSSLSKSDLNKNHKDGQPHEEDKVAELRQPVKRREFINDEQGTAFDVLKKRIQSRRYDMNAHDDDDIDNDSNNVFD